VPRVTARAIPLYENGVVKMAVPIINTNKFMNLPIVCLLIKLLRNK
tara:strand:+ start:594 stop:731 length:138 start_codon:yes stop_codon:yes gene_type:complete